MKTDQPDLYQENIKSLKLERKPALCIYIYISYRLDIAVSIDLQNRERKK